MRNTYALINLKNLENNIKEIISYYPYEYYFGVIKANAYGHGFKVIPTMEKAGINYFCVATLEEAQEARKLTNKPILIFGYVNIKDINIVKKNKFTLSIISYEYFKELIKVNPSIKVHLKINTGMNRMGINNKEQINEVITKIKDSSMELEGIYSHLATSGVNDGYYDKQINNFKELTSDINLSNIPIVHLFNSLALARHDKLPFCNGVRIGLMMYGFTYNINLSKLSLLKKKLFHKHLSPTTLTNSLKLQKVLSLHSEVININQIHSGDFVGYGAKYIAKKDTFIAIIPIGHGDGITNAYQKVMINNYVYPIVSLCMDYLMVEVDNNVKLYDKVDLINQELPISQIK